MRTTLQAAVLVASTVALAAAVAPRAAHASTCQRSCLIGSGVCGRETALALRACKMRCASDPTPRACRRACRTTARSARATCGTSFADCESGCPATSAPGTCPAGCGSDAQTCFIDVRSAGRTCVEGCIAGGASRGDCFGHCAGELKGGVATCVAALASCLGACQGNVTGNCFDTVALRCTDLACDPTAPCAEPNEFCASRCAPPPSPSGTCFDPFTRQCGGPCSPTQPCSSTDGAFVGSTPSFCVPQCPPPLPSGVCLDPATAQCGASCSPTAPCPTKQLCVPACPPPLPTGKCFDTVARQCADESCSLRKPCSLPSERCTLQCPPPSPTTTTTLPGGGCTRDADCDDGNGCTVDRCVDGACEHVCVCVEPTSGSSCCGPGPLCVTPTTSTTLPSACGAVVGGTCDGSCPFRATCEPAPTAGVLGGCRCVSGEGGPCGGNIDAPPAVCAPALVCQQANPDATGVCVVPGCVPLFTSGCTQTADCCEPCSRLGRAPCGVCIQGFCSGAP